MTLVRRFALAPLLLLLTTGAAPLPEQGSDPDYVARAELARQTRLLERQIELQEAILRELRAQTVLMLSYPVARSGPP